MLATFASVGLAVLPFVSAAVHDIQVAPGGQLMFDPPAIAAQPGDQVVFHFHPKNHTVTQSSFDNPCGLKEGGFDSGFVPVLANQTDQLPTYAITVDDTTPIWVFCNQAANTPQSHCGAGMVFAVNCGSDNEPNSFTNFRNAALAIGQSLSASAAAASPTAGGGYGGGYGGSYGGGDGGNYGGNAGDSAATTTWTAAYGDVTIPPAPDAQVVTETIVLDGSTWATTYTSFAGSPAPTPETLEGVEHRVIVGGGSGLVFDPPRVDAKPRDRVVFEFHQKNHTVTQSTFADPCRRLSSNGVLGFDSGFFPVSADSTSDFPTWTLTVNDTAPIWAYCRQKTPSSHCGAGMVFAINSDESGERDYAAFQRVAAQLNGTAAAANSPNPTAANDSSAASIKLGATSIVALVGLIASTLL